MKTHLVEYRDQVCPSEVNRSGMSSRARTNNHNLRVLLLTLLSMRLGLIDGYSVGVAVRDR